MTCTQNLDYFYSNLSFDTDFLEVYAKKELLALANQFLEDVLAVSDTDLLTHEAMDNIHEWADSMVSIYIYDIWQKAPKFRHFTNEAMENYGITNSTDILELLRL